MDTVFPFGLPQASAIYLSLYVVTFAIHIVLMSYVLAGTGYLAVSAVARRRSNADPGAIERLLTDWLPFGLGAAITAGVAPLLFVQVLYRKSFYTANLLLFNRWMAIVPVLIVGFYLLYLHKSERTASWRPALRAAVPATAFACFLFVAYSWTENHLLAMAPEHWVSFYAEARVAYASADLLPRLGMWLFATLPTLALIVGIQVGRDCATHARRLTVIACTGIVGLAACGSWYYAGLDAAARDAVTAPMAKPYLIAGAIGLALQIGAWAMVWRRRFIARRPVVLAAGGLACTTVGIAVARESLRMSRFDSSALSQLHARTAEAGGMLLFFAFLVGNGLVIAWCFRITRRGLRGSE